MRKSEWTPCQDPGGWGFAGRMWSVCIFCLPLKLLPRKYMPRCHAPSQGGPRQHSIAPEQSCKNKPASFTQPWCQPVRPARAGQAAWGLGTIWSSGREGRKTISNSRRPGPLTDRPLLGEGKTTPCKGARWRLWEGRGY